MERIIIVDVENKYDLQEVVINGQLEDFEIANLLDAMYGIQGWINWEDKFK